MGQPEEEQKRWAARPGDDPGDLCAFFDAAMEAIYPYLWRRCGHDRATAEDLCQEAFVTAVRALQQGDIDVLDHCRREARRERHLHLLGSDSVADIDEVVVESAALEKLLGELPAAQRLNVVLHHLDGMSVPEIAVATSASVRAVESSLARARRTLRDLMEGDRK
jgi:RNA polymerase sigma factor (sigma-70 family)